MIPPRKKQQQFIQEYFDSIRTLKKESCDQGMLDKEFMKLYEKTLDSLTSAPQKSSNFTKSKKYGALLLLSLTLIIVTAKYKVIYSCIACNLQDYIYPGLRLLRTFFIPILTWFTPLTGK